jgi:hypothetical protein
MKPRIGTRTYTNYILTAIAALLLLLTIKAYRISMTSTAYAQDETEATPRPSSIFGAPGRSAPLDLSNVAQTQDTAVASATTEVANANRDIAAALREVAAAIRDAGGSIASSSEAVRSSGGSTVPAASSSSAPSGSSDENVIEVSPSRAR